MDQELLLRSEIKLLEEFLMDIPADQPISRLSFEGRLKQVKEELKELLNSNE